MQDFDEIYEQHYMRIYKYLMSLCQNPSMAEEITQETFFRAYKGIDGFRGDCRISSWLCQIAKNTYYSRRKRERSQFGEIPAEAVEDVEAHFLMKEAAYGAHRALHGLREPYKEVFWLKTFGELSFRQIGELFGRSENWSRVTYYRAKIMIREELE